MKSHAALFAGMFGLSLYATWPHIHLFNSEDNTNTNEDSEVAPKSVVPQVIQAEDTSVVLHPSTHRGLGTDEEVLASSCFTCFSPAWGWYMGPFSGHATYTFNMYRSNTNGCTREDGDSDTLSGNVVVKVDDADNDGQLEFEVTVLTERKVDYDETQVYVDTDEPPYNRPPPGKDSSKCYASGGSDATCTSASGVKQVHDITLGTANSKAITKEDQYYIWIHAAESYTGETVYARSNLAVACPNVAISTTESPTVAAIAPPVPVPPTPSPVVAPTPLGESPAPPAPTPSPVQGSSNSQDFGGSCFHGDGTVLLQSGASKALKDLQVGESIMTSDEHGKFSFSPVVVLPHAKNEEPAAFLTLTTETGKTLEMTSDHLIPKCDLLGHKEVTAGDLVVGDCLVTADGKETLISISWTSKPGVYTAVTKNKYLLVNSIVASPFSKDADLEHPENDFAKYRLELERTRVQNMIASGKRLRAGGP